MFEKASRLKLRFDSPKGLLTVEDLWDLPLTTTVTKGASLDNVARGISRQLKESETESFVEVSTATNTILNLKLDIVKHVISVRLDDYALALTKKENKEKKEKILAALAKKQDAAFDSASEEDLKKMLDSL